MHLTVAMADAWLRINSLRRIVPCVYVYVYALGCVAVCMCVYVAYAIYADLRRRKHASVMSRQIS